MLGIFAVLLGLIPQVAEFAGGLIPNIGVELVSEAIEDFTEGFGQKAKLNREASSGYHAAMQLVAERIANATEEEKRTYDNILTDLNKQVNKERSWVEKLKRKTPEDTFASDMLRDFLGELEGFEAEKYIQKNFPDIVNKYGRKDADGEYLTPIYGVFIELMGIYSEELYRVCFNNLPREQRSVIKILQHSYDTTFSSIKEGVDDAVKKSVSDAFSVLLQQHEPMTQIASSDIIKSPFAFVKRVCPNCGYDGEYLYFDKKNSDVYCSACGSYYDIIDNRQEQTKELKKYISDKTDEVLRKLDSTKVLKKLDSTDETIKSEVGRIIKTQVSFEVFKADAEKKDKSLKDIQASIDAVAKNFVEEILNTNHDIAEKFFSMSRQQVADTNMLCGLMRNAGNSLVNMQYEIGKVLEYIKAERERETVKERYVCKVCGAVRLVNERRCKVCHEPEYSSKYIKEHTATMSYNKDRNALVVDYKGNEENIASDGFMILSTEKDRQLDCLITDDEQILQKVTKLVILSPEAIQTFGEGESPFKKFSSLAVIIINRGCFTALSQTEFQAGAFRNNITKINVYGTVYSGSGFVSKEDKKIKLEKISEN